MKKIINFLFSFRLMGVLILVFAFSIATATFIEADYGSSTARAVVYDATWFSLLLFIGLVNLTGAIFTQKLYRREKLSIFVFHIAFLFILLGAAVTRYFGQEGFMHIRQGDTSDTMITDDVFFYATARSGHDSAYKETPVMYSGLSGNEHTLSLHPGNHKVVVKCVGIIPNASRTIKDDPEGQPIIELVSANSSGRVITFLKNKETQTIGNITFSLNDTLNHAGVSIFSKKDSLSLVSAVPGHLMHMQTQQSDTVKANTRLPFHLLTLYNFDGLQVVAKKFNPSGKITILSAGKAESGSGVDAIELNVKADRVEKNLVYFAKQESLNPPMNFNVNRINLSVSYGAKTVKLPFSIKLNKFILKHYPGSQSPSWFESRIQLLDPSRNIHADHRIFMNNVLSYRGYRFYQSSYDSDEGGTILSVNHDFWGTVITYLGYLLLAIGIVISLFNRKSRLHYLSKKLTQLQGASKIIPFLFLMVLCSFGTMGHASARSALPDSVTIDRQEAVKFGKLMVQDSKGRIKPVNSLSSELIRKITRTISYKGMTSDQVFLSMMIYPKYWEHVPMIKVSDPGVKKLLHLSGDYVSFMGVIDTSSSHQYILEPYVNAAYQKKPVHRNKFDNDVMRLDESINLCYLIYSGNLLHIFPKADDPNQTWYAPDKAGKVFKGNDSLFTTSIIPIYFQIIRNSEQSKQWKRADEALNLIKNFQKKYGGDLIPSATKLKYELLYNRIDIFDWLGAIYGIVGFILLVFQFLSVFFRKLNMKPFIMGATILLIACFITHFAGLMLRWYISGHAPWSNAYESLLYIAFATVLAGIIFSRKSGIALSSAAIIAWLILFVAHLNWMDPEITNLVPVLKSYWLVIHVAVITASYGFLSLGALLALINLLTMIFQTSKNKLYTGGVIGQLTIITEMTLIIGLYMITIGTFLGGVWANESWGKYWGWDPKETWALVSILVYAFVVHTRMIPGLKGNYTFNLLALLGFSSIIMTYFGVNYYLAGLHSYAKGEPIPIPVFVYYAIAIVAVIVFLSWWNQHRMSKYGHSIFEKS